MKDIYAITTHHEDPDAAAETWKEEGVCAVGWSSFGDLRKPKKPLGEEQKLFMAIEREDVILAYATDNTIAYVGQVVGGFRPNDRNKVGRSEENDGFGYSNQYRVKWWRDPHHFNRFQLPAELCEQIGKPHRTIVRLELCSFEFDDIIRIIKHSIKTGSALDKLEDLVKAGLLKYFRKGIDKLEGGLEITHHEEFTSQSDRPDFVGTDADGNVVLIECKGTARERDCDQLERYRRNYPKGKKRRSMLVAFKFEPNCKKAARSKDIELVECDLNFKKL